MEILDYIRSASLTIGLVTCILAGPRTWQLANSVLLLGYGLTEYFIPVFLLEDVVEGGYDKYHIYLMRLIGAQLFSLGVVGFICRSSRNKAVWTSFLLSWAVWGVVEMQCGVLGYLRTRGEKPALSETFITFVMLSALLMAIGNGYHALRNVSYAGGTISLRNRVSIHIIIDLSIHSAWLVIDYAHPEKFFPHFVGDKPDGVHIYLMQFIGVNGLCCVLHGILSLALPNDKDKRIYLLGRLLLYIIILPAFAWSQWKDDLFPRSEIYCTCFAFFITIANAMCGYFHSISLPKFKGD